MRLLDVGCGWGGMVMHAAEHHGVRAVGVTLSRRQAELAEKRVAEAGLSEGRRDPPAGLPRRHRRPVRRHQLDRHVRARGRGPPRPSTSAGCARCCGPRAACSTTASAARSGQRPRLPAPQLHRTATCSPTASCTRSAGWCRSCRTPGSRSATSRRCASTTPSRCASGSPTSRPTGTRRSTRSAQARARVWRLYMAASAINFEAGRTQIHQVLATPVTADGRSGMPLRPVFE